MMRIDRTPSFTTVLASCLSLCLRCTTLSEPGKLIHKDQLMEVIQILSQGVKVKCKICWSLQIFRTCFHHVSSTYITYVNIYQHRSVTYQHQHQHISVIYPYINKYIYQQIYIYIYISISIYPTYIRSPALTFLLEALHCVCTWNIFLLDHWHRIESWKHKTYGGTAKIKIGMGENTRVDWLEHQDARTSRRAYESRSPALTFLLEALHCVCTWNIFLLDHWHRIESWKHKTSIFPNSTLYLVHAIWETKHSEKYLQTRNVQLAAKPRERIRKGQKLSVELFQVWLIGIERRKPPGCKFPWPADLSIFHVDDKVRRLQSAVWSKSHLLAGGNLSPEFFRLGGLYQAPKHEVPVWILISKSVQF